MPKNKSINKAYAKHAPTNSPFYVVCTISFHKDALKEMLETLTDRGYFEGEIRESRNHKLYVVVNDFWYMSEDEREEVKKWREMRRKIWGNRKKVLLHEYFERLADAPILDEDGDPIDEEL